MSSSRHGAPSRSVHHNNLMNKAGSINQLKACIGIPPSAQPQMQQQQKQQLLHHALYNMKHSHENNGRTNVSSQLYAGASNDTSKPNPVSSREPPPGFSQQPAPVAMQMSMPPQPPVPTTAAPSRPSALDRLISSHFDNNNTENVSGNMAGSNGMNGNIPASSFSESSLKQLLGLKVSDKKVEGPKSIVPTSTSGHTTTTPAPLHDMESRLKSMLINGDRSSSPPVDVDTKLQPDVQTQQRIEEDKRRSASLGERTPGAPSGNANKKEVNRSDKNGNRGEKERSASLDDAKKKQRKDNCKKQKETNNNHKDVGTSNFATSKFMASPDPTNMPMPDFDESFFGEDD